MGGAAIFQHQKSTIRVANSLRSARLDIHATSISFAQRPSGIHVAAIQSHRRRRLIVRAGHMSAVEQQDVLGSTPHPGNNGSSWTQRKLVGPIHFAVNLALVRVNVAQDERANTCHTSAIQCHLDVPFLFISSGCTLGLKQKSWSLMAKSKKRSGWAATALGCSYQIGRSLYKKVG